MIKTIPVEIFVYAYFSKYAVPGEQPMYVTLMYASTSENYVLVTKKVMELKIEVPDDVQDFTPARLAAFEAKKVQINLSAAEDIKEIDDEIQKLLAIEYQ